jgi:hypothetical protein
VANEERAQRHECLSRSPRGRGAERESREIDRWNVLRLNRGRGVRNIADLHDVDDADEFVGGAARNSRRRSDTRLSPTEAEDLRAPPPRTVAAE